jgi:hypothetical protein
MCQFVLLGRWGDNLKNRRKGVMSSVQWPEKSSSPLPSCMSFNYTSSATFNEYCLFFYDLILFVLKLPCFLLFCSECIHVMGLRLYFIHFNISTLTHPPRIRISTKRLRNDGTSTTSGWRRLLVSSYIPQSMYTERGGRVQWGEP